MHRLPVSWLRSLMKVVQRVRAAPVGRVALQSAAVSTQGVWGQLREQDLFEYLLLLCRLLIACTAAPLSHGSCPSSCCSLLVALQLYCIAILCVKAGQQLSPTM